MSEGRGHKLLAHFDGVPLIRQVASRAHRSEADQVIVVTGFRGDEIGAQLANLDVTILDNPQYSSGLSSSIKTGLTAVNMAKCAGILILLGDMPAIETDHINLILRTFRSEGGNKVVRATSSGKSGHPIILPSSLFSKLLAMSGDNGARKLIVESGQAIVDVEIGPPALIDVDTYEDLIAAGGEAGEKCDR